jgi:hypothetical protein
MGQTAAASGMAEAAASDAARADAANKRRAIAAKEANRALPYERATWRPGRHWSLVSVRVERCVSIWRSRRLALFVLAPTRIAPGKRGAIGLWDSFASCARLSVWSGGCALARGSRCKMPSAAKAGLKGKHLRHDCSRVLPSYRCFPTDSSAHRGLGEVRDLQTVLSELSGTCLVPDWR